MNIDKSKFNLKQFFLICLLIFITASEVLMDYVHAGFDPSVFKDTSYWVELGLTVLSVIFVALSARAYSREREINANQDVKEVQAKIKGAHEGLVSHDLMTKFEDYVKQRNDEKKLSAYTAYLQRRMMFARINKKKYWAEKLETADRDIHCFKVAGKHIKVGSRWIRYVPIKTSTIFSGVDLNSNDDDDLYGNEGKAISKMVIQKLTMIVAMSFAFSTLFFTNQVIGLGVIVSTLAKLFRIASSAFTGMTDGANFVKYTLQDKMKRRLDFIQKFLEKEKAA
jgi:hypothetical protein|nr:MAG TPA: hypothetical protein [Caudoviricetes sp.]